MRKENIDVDMKNFPYEEGETKDTTSIEVGKEEMGQEKDIEVAFLDGKWETVDTASMRVGEILSQEATQIKLSQGDSVSFKEKIEIGGAVERIIKPLVEMALFNEQQKKLDNIYEFLTETIDPFLKKYQQDMAELFEAKKLTLEEEKFDYEEMAGKTDKAYAFLLEQINEVNQLIQKSPVRILDQYMEQLVRMERQQSDLCLFRVIFSHDSSGVISALKGALGEVVMSPEEERSEVYEMYKDVVASGISSFPTLLKNIIALSKNPEFEEFSAKTLIDEEFELLRTRAGIKKIKLVLNIDEKIKIYSDKIFLRQIIRNLVNNSIKFQEGGEIKISLQEGQDGGPELSIEDEGIGMDKDILAEAKKMFNRGDIVPLGSRLGTRKEEGTGNGLMGICYISRKIFIEEGEISSTNETDSFESGTGTMIKLLLLNKGKVKELQTEEEQEIIDIAKERIKEKQFGQFTCIKTSQGDPLFSKASHPEAFTFALGNYDLSPEGKLPSDLSLEEEKLIVKLMFPEEENIRDIDARFLEKIKTKDLVTKEDA